MVRTFKGLSAFPITPMNVDGRVDASLLRRLLTRLVDAGVSSIGLLGSTGSYPYLSRAERRRTVEIAVEHVGAIPVFVGIGALRTDEAIELAKDARAAGAKAGLLAPVSYTPLTDDEVFEHFTCVARATDLPLCIYNNPGTTHFTFSAALIGRLSYLPCVGGVKNPAPPAELVAGDLKTLRALVPDSFSLGYSVDKHSVEALLAGSDVWYSVIAGLFPEPCMQIMRAIERGDPTEARRLSTTLQPIWDLFTRHSGLRVVYAAAKVLGLCSKEPPRPILPLAEDIQKRIAQALEKLALN